MRYGVLLLLAVGLLACSEADPIQPPPEEEPAPEPRPADISEMRVTKVRGDQSVQVPPPEVAGPTIRAVVGQDGWTSEPLVARIVVQPTGGLQVLQAGDSVYVPKGTLVHWLLDDGAGRLFASTTATDDTATTVNRWAPGTKAGRFRARAGRLVGTEIVYDAEWELEVLPGPVVQVGLDARALDGRMLRAGDTIDIRTLVYMGRDAYGNETPRDSIIAWRDDAIGWAWSSRVCRPGCPMLPTEPTDTGWVAVVPEPGEDALGHDGRYHLWLSIWFPVDDPKRVQVVVYPDQWPPEDPPN